MDDNEDGNRQPTMTPKLTTTDNDTVLALQKVTESKQRTVNYSAPQIKNAVSTF